MGIALAPAMVQLGHKRMNVGGKPARVLTEVVEKGDKFGASAGSTQAAVPSRARQRSSAARRLRLANSPK